MTARDVLALCRRDGIELTTAAGKLRFRGPAQIVGAELRALLSEHKAALLRLIAPCPECGRPLDVGRCWRCHCRACEICTTRTTGSAFIATCLTCQFQADQTQ